MTWLQDRLCGRCRSNQVRCRMRVITPYAILVVAIAVAPGAFADSPAELQRVTTAEQKWISLGAVSYKYTLGVSVGSVFGWGEFKITVKNGVCTSRHIGGTGFGRRRFIERFRFAQIGRAHV